MTGDLGYTFHRPEYAPSVEHPQLDINVYAKPTREHFDPQQASFHVATDKGCIERLIVMHPWHERKQYHVCPGRVILRDRKGKVVEAATCGGDLTISNEKRYTHCSLISRAPIIQLANDIASLETVLVSEIEALLAKRRAELHHDDVEYEKRLATVDPLMLFMVSLATLEERLLKVPAVLRRDRYQKACHIVQQAIRMLQKRGAWTTSLPSLADLI
jgi:hypothetical protein